MPYEQLSKNVLLLEDDTRHLERMKDFVRELGYEPHGVTYANGFMQLHRDVPCYAAIVDNYVPRHIDGPIRKHAGASCVLDLYQKNQNFDQFKVAIQSSEHSSIIEMAQEAGAIFIPKQEVSLQRLEEFLTKGI